MPYNSDYPLSTIEADLLKLNKKEAILGKFGGTPTSYIFYRLIRARLNECIIYDLHIKKIQSKKNLFDS